MLTTALLCVALNVYHESRGEPLEGKIAVAYVTSKYAGKKPKNYCNAVYEKKPSGEGVFSWTTDPETIPADRTSIEWKESVAVAKTFKNYPDYSKGATNYHALRVHPVWRKSMVKVASIGHHIFYLDPNPV